MKNTHPDLLLACMIILPTGALVYKMKDPNFGSLSTPQSISLQVQPQTDYLSMYIERVETTQYNERYAFVSSEAPDSKSKEKGFRITYPLLIPEQSKATVGEWVLVQYELTGFGSDKEISDRIAKAKIIP